MGHDHGHSHSHSANKKTLTISLVIITLYMAVEVIGGLLTNSLALLADAKATNLTANNVYGYLPVAIIPDEVISWLDSSIKKVTIL